MFFVIKINKNSDLGSNASGAKTVSEACDFVNSTLEKHSFDISFSALYMRDNLDDKNSYIRLINSSHIEKGIKHLYKYNIYFNKKAIYKIIYINV